MSAVAMAPEQRWPGCVAAMDALAQSLLDSSPADGEQIAQALLHAFPGAGEARCLNRASIAIAQHRRIQRELQEGYAADLARVRKKGYRVQHDHPGLEQEGADGDVLIDEPTDAELAQIERGSELLALCARYELYFRVDDDGALRTSRPVVKGGTLYRAMKRYRAGLIAGLRERLP